MTPRRKRPVSQPGILAAIPPVGRSLAFRLEPGGDPRAALTRLRCGFDPAWGVMGIGDPLARALGCGIPGLRAFPVMETPGSRIPSTQQALWFLLRGRDRGAVFDLSERLLHLCDAPDRGAAGHAAGRRGLRIGWRQHARVGIPVTLATLALSGAWLWLRL
jgi:hypothetical protein